MGHPGTVPAQAPARRTGAARVETLLIVDDHPLMCDALALTLKMAFGLRKTRAARSLAAAVDSIRADGPQTHLSKIGTPTMGGLMILIAVTVSLFLWMDLSNRYVWACIGVTTSFFPSPFTS